MSQRLSTDVWKVSGTSPDTEDASIKVKVVAKPTVSWSSYFYTSTEWGVQESSYEISQEFEVPAPNRSDVGFLKINNTGDENGNAFAIFAVRAIDVTDPNNTFVAYENLNSVFVKKGDTMLKTNDVVHGCVCLEAGVLLDIFSPYRKDFVED